MSGASVLVLLGPTATGKTALLQTLAERHPIEVLSCDSRQVYEGMPIGTAQPDADVLSSIKHHLVGFLRPDKSFSAGEFRRACNALIPQILSRNAIPVISGGTGFYFRAMSTEMIELVDDDDLRASVHAMSHEERLTLLRAKDSLSLCEPGGMSAAGRVHPNDVYRVERALYILLLTGRPLRQSYEAGFQRRTDLNFCGVVLDLDADVWKEQIAKRALQMMEAGLVDEAVAVQSRFGHCAALHTPGYAEALQFASGQIDREELTERFIRSHLQYGRRQRVWFKKESLLEPVAGVDFAIARLENLIVSGFRS